MNANLPLPTVKLNNPQLFSAIANLSTSGLLICNNDGLTYLKIDDNFIHQAFAFLTDKQLSKPKYFTAEKNFIGAHISVIYPSEEQNCPPEYLSNIYDFEIVSLITASLEEKTYYALKVNSPSLAKLRHSLNLPGQLSYKNYLLDFHITIAVQMSNKKGA